MIFRNSLATSFTLFIQQFSGIRLGSLKVLAMVSEWERNALNTTLTDQYAPNLDDWANNSTYLWKFLRALDCILSNISPSMLKMLATSTISHLEPQPSR